MIRLIYDSARCSRGLCCCVLVLILSGSQGLYAEPPLICTRRFNIGYYTPAEKLLVTIQVDPDTGVRVWAVEESPPPGWAVADISHDRVYDAVNHKVKWGPFFDHQSRLLTYSVTPPAGEIGKVIFTGAAGYDAGNMVATVGEVSLGPSPDGGSGGGGGGVLSPQDTTKDEGGTRGDGSLKLLVTDGVVTGEVIISEAAAGKKVNARLITDVEQGFAGIGEGDGAGVMPYWVAVDADLNPGTFQAVIKLCFDPNGLETAGLTDADLIIYRWDEENEIWVHAGENDVGLSAPTGSVGDYGWFDGCIWAVVDHLTEFVGAYPYPEEVVSDPETDENGVPDPDQEDSDDQADDSPDAGAPLPGGLEDPENDDPDETDQSSPKPPFRCGFGAAQTVTVAVPFLWIMSFRRRLDLLRNI